MPFGMEIFYGIGAVVLLGGLIWGVIQYRRRNRANDPITEKATHELYKHPETYPERREALKKDTRSS